MSDDRPSRDDRRRASTITTVNAAVDHAVLMVLEGNPAFSPQEVALALFDIAATFALDQQIAAKDLIERTCRLGMAKIHTATSSAPAGLVS